MTWEGFQYFRRGFKVYSNYGLKFPHTLLTKKVFDEMIKNKEQLQNAVLLLDEMHVWIDSRSSMKQKNKGITYFILQTRKRNVRLLYSTQHLHQVDKRLRDSTDVIVFCRNLSNKTSTVKSADAPTYILLESVFQWREEMTPKKRILYANPVYPLYDTTEMIDWTDDS